MGWREILGLKKTPKAEFVKEYEFLFNIPIPKIRSIHRLPFTVLDTETTGLDPRKDYILSFGAIKMTGYKLHISSTQEMYLNAPIKNEEAVKVHGIISGTKASPLPVFAREFLKFVGTDIIVGHHIGFDIAMLEKALKPFGLSRIKNPILDTLDLAIRIEKGPQFGNQLVSPEYSLDQLCERYHIPLDDRHTAAGDAFITAQLLLKLLKMAEKKGIDNYGRLI